ncbi:MAG: DNA recombination protein RmuC [Bacilli bacterium]|nr:DNA recombination protein RmuC [Bacilli bacterium]
MEYALLAVLIVVFIGLVILTIFVIKLSKKPNKVDGTISEKELGMLSQQIKSLEEVLKKDIEISLAKEMLQVNEANNQKLERFQSNIIEQMTNRFEAINLQLGEKMKEINQKVEDKLKEGFQGTSETMAQVRERLKVIDEAQKNMESLSKDVVSLRSIMEGNQTRGAYGEYQLNMVLHNVFGDTVGCYQEQYTIKKVKDGDDVRADAVVFMPEPNKMICIDSKFPFQDYERLMKEDNESAKEEYKKQFAAAVKKHITVIKDKYIIDGKTAPEALMFIPNDGVFAYIHQELLDVVDYAREKRVILTSPSTLPAILVTINMVRIEAERAKNVKEISKQLDFLGRQFAMFSKEWDTFSKQLETASRSREKLDTRVNRITTKFDAISTNSDVEIEAIEENKADD